MEANGTDIERARPYHQLIRSNYVGLLEHVDLESKTVIGHLLAKGIITDVDKAKIQACSTNNDMNDILFTMMLRKPLSQIQGLQAALIASKQKHIVDAYLTLPGEASQRPSEPETEDICDPDADQLSSSEPPSLSVSSLRNEGSSFALDRTQPRWDESEVMPVSLINGALHGERQDLYTLEGLVINKSKMSHYSKKNDKVVFYFTVTVCDTSDVTNIRIYHVRKFNKVKIGKYYRFKNVKRRADLFLLVGTAFIDMVPPMTVPDGILEKAQSFSQLLQPNTIRSLTQALEAMNSSHVSGRIVKVSTLKFMDDGTRKRHLALIDSQGMTPVRVAIYGQNAEQNYKEGQCVEITYAYPREDPKGVKYLCTKKEATVQDIPNPPKTEKLLHLKWSGIFEDPEFVDPKVLRFKIRAIDSAGIYDCCLNQACKKRKLSEEGDCRTCPDPSPGKHYWVKVVMEYVEEGIERRHSLFQGRLEQMFTLRSIDEYTNEESLIEDILSQLPVCGEVTLQGDSIVSITVYGDQR